MSYRRHHHHHTQCIPPIRVLWSGSGEGRYVASHTYKGRRSQRVLQLEIDPQNDINLQRKAVSETETASLHLTIQA